MERNTILIVDDMEVNRAILRSLFQEKYNVLEAENGEQAIVLLNQFQEKIEIVLLDIVMPVVNGYEVMAEMNQSHLLDKIPVIVITSEGSSENEVRAFDLGASDILVKPFEPHVVCRRVQNVVELNRHRLHLEELVEQQALNLQESKNVLMDALTSVIEHRSMESGQHVLRIRMFTKLLLEDVMHSYPEYGLDERKIGVISSAASLHDIGKIAIPDAILNKPGKLTFEEFEIMKTHTIRGCEILAGLQRMHDKEYLRYAFNICRYHHERWDGKGYPEGLQGDNIPLCAQVVSIADVYDALTTDRVYKKAYEPDVACNMILNGECGIFSPLLLESFKNIRESFASLAKDYMDNAPHVGEEIEAPLAGRLSEPMNTQELGQMKYFTLLRYVDSTVVELDMDQRVFHMVYTHNHDLDALRSANVFSEAYGNFVKTSVLEADWEKIPEEKDFKEFLDSGMMKKTYRIHVFHRSAGEYVEYDMNLLRINLDNPNLRKMLILWQEVDFPGPPVGGAGSPAEQVIMGNSMVGVLKLLNDGKLTMVEVNGGFVDLLGYTVDELHVLFHKRYTEMIHPQDLPGVLRHYRESIYHGNTFEWECRMKAKDGRLLWVMHKCQLVVDEQGIEYVNCVLLDITQTKQEQEDLRLTIERYQIIMNQTNDTVFHWNLATNALDYSYNWVEKFGYDPAQETLPSFIASRLIPEEAPMFQEKIGEVMEGAPSVEAELQIAGVNGVYNWVRMNVITQFDSAGKPVSAVGIMHDIDSEKRHAQDLMDRAERDNLTHLYNKASARQRIRNLLRAHRAQNTPAAMMILDLDNFKIINDSLGHMFGDAVLIGVASNLKKLFEPGNVISRIGGDEFLLFINSVSDRERLQERVELLIAMMSELFSEELQEFALSCSVGIAYAPEHGAHFQELFLNCDRALYRAKALGKRQYAVYDNETMGGTFDTGVRRTVAANTRIESNGLFEKKSVDIIQQAFRVLYQARSVDQGIQDLLELVGTACQVDRVYVAEDAPGGKFFTNTFEWCGQGIAPLADKVQNIPYEEKMVGSKDRFQENGIFYCSDVSMLSQECKESLKQAHICAVLQYAIYEAGKIVGFVGFDDCRGRRLWTQDQIDILSFVSSLLSNVLMKKRAQEQAEESFDDLKAILDSQDSYLYVVDPSTRRLCYVSSKIRRNFTKNILGLCCYEVLGERTAPCPSCPMEGLKRQTHGTAEVYDPRFNQWTKLSASAIRWKGADACLMCCHDISRYKENVSILPKEE